jgi:hypothetical protein
MQSPMFSHTTTAIVSDTISHNHHHSDNDNNSNNNDNTIISKKFKIYNPNELTTTYCYYHNTSYCCNSNEFSSHTSSPCSSPRMQISPTQNQQQQQQQQHHQHHHFHTTKVNNTVLLFEDDKILLNYYNEIQVIMFVNKKKRKTHYLKIEFKKEIEHVTISMALRKSRFSLSVQYNEDESQSKLLSMLLNTSSDDFHSSSFSPRISPKTPESSTLSHNEINSMDTSNDSPNIHNNSIINMPSKIFECNLETNHFLFDHSSSLLKYVIMVEDEKGDNILMYFLRHDINNMDTF